MQGASEAAPPGASRRPVVLLVEDAILLRLQVADFLRERRFQVIEAAQADETVEVLEAGLAVDVVVSDIRLPRGRRDGFGLVTWISAHRADVKVILTSGVVSRMPDAVAARVRGPILAKPYDEAELERLVRAAIEGT